MIELLKLTTDVFDVKLFELIKLAVPFLKNEKKNEQILFHTESHCMYIAKIY